MSLRENIVRCKHALIYKIGARFPYSKTRVWALRSLGYEIGSDVYIPQDLKITQVAVAGGVSANSALRQAFVDYGNKYHWDVFIPPFSFTTDNAAMVCQAGYFKYLDQDFCAIDDRSRKPPFKEQWTKCKE